MTKSVILWTTRKNSKSWTLSNRIRGPKTFRRNFNIMGSVSIIPFWCIHRTKCTAWYIISAAGNSEDSDYTSDFNYPICQQQANSSASQFRNFADQLEMSPCSSPDHPNTSTLKFVVIICFFNFNNKSMTIKHLTRGNRKIQKINIY